MAAGEHRRSQPQPFQIGGPPAVVEFVDHGRRQTGLVRPQWRRREREFGLVVHDGGLMGPQSPSWTQMACSIAATSALARLAKRPRNRSLLIVVSWFAMALRCLPLTRT
jgi:hypothetical protein